MPRIETRRAHQLAFRQRFSRPVRWLACAGLLAGIFLVFVPRFYPSRSARTATKPVAAGFILAMLSAGFIWGRRGKLIDREARTITLWWGAPWPLARTTYELASFQAVAVTPYERDGRLRWRIALLTPDGERLDLFDLCDAVSAARAAEQIGEFLTLPVHSAPAPPPPEHEEPQGEPS